LQQESPKRNIFLWLFVFAQGIWLLLWKKSTYPKYLVLEYGIDTPGEMQFMLNIARPDIGFLTNISPGHLEQFGTLEAYGKEKFLLLQSAQYPCYNGDDYGIR
jgi:UDP-N-acetylmuramoyl-tripeptide--D-alanyl-D-alanine ligase